MRNQVQRPGVAAKAGCQPEPVLPFYNPDYLSWVGHHDIETSCELLEKVVELTKTPQEKARAIFLLRAFQYYEASAISYLGLLKGARQPGMSEAYYEYMNTRRFMLFKEFQKDPLLRQPVELYDKRLTKYMW